MIKKLVILVVLLSFVSPSILFAQGKYDIKEMTPEVLSALEARRDRYDQLQALKNEGIIGEGNKGYVIVLKEDKNAKTVAESENSNRKKIYQTIAQQNNLKDSLGVIEKVFAQVQRDNADAGDYIQTEDGDWVQKQISR